MQESKQREVSMRRVFYLSTIDLLIVGPSKTHTHHLRETDGERFFEDCLHVKFAKDFLRVTALVRDTYDTKTIVKKCVMRSCILSCLSCLHSAEVRFVDSSSTQKFDVALS